MSIQFTEDFINSLNNISKLFLCRTDIKAINWNHLLYPKTSLLDDRQYHQMFYSDKETTVLVMKLLCSKGLTNHILQQPDVVAAQLFILESTIFHHLSIKYPVRNSYCRFFLKCLISELERQQIEVADTVYATYCNILEENIKDQYHYRHFQLPDKSFVTLKESSNFISEGTTGLYTWQGALALAEWCINNTELLRDSHLLELGCGVGLTGIVVSSVCAPAKYCFSDCHLGVLHLLDHNIKLNETPESKSSPISSCNKNRFIRNTPIEVLQIDWEEVDDLQIESNPDIILAADVIYDNSLFSPLINTLKHFLTSANVKAVLACTERNPETLSQFLTSLESSGLTAVEEPQVKPCIFAFSLGTPVRIFIVHNG